MTSLVVSVGIKLQLRGTESETQGLNIPQSHSWRKHALLFRSKKTMFEYKRIALGLLELHSERYLIDIYSSVSEIQGFSISVFSLVAMPEMLFSLCHTGFSYLSFLLCEILKGTFSPSAFSNVPSGRIWYKVIPMLTFFVFQPTLNFHISEFVLGSC